jgi:hypothetical protein
MHWQASFHQEPRYIRVAVTGLPTVKDMLQVVDQIAAHIAGSPAAKVLIDLRGVQTLFGFTEQFTMGTRVAELLRRAKVASVVPVYRRTGVSQKAAQHQGARLQVFTEDAEAVAWLMEAD